MFNNKLSFLSSNVKGIFQKLKHTPRQLDVKKKKKKWNSDFQGQLFFSHSKANSSGVAIDYCGKKSFELLNKFNDISGRILITEVKIENEMLLLINLYNANTENE